MAVAVLAECGDEFGQPPDYLGTRNGIAVITRVHDLAVPDRQHHEEAQRERLSGLGELTAQFVFDDDHVGAGGLVDDDVAQALISPARRSRPETRAQFLAGGLDPGGNERRDGKRHLNDHAGGVTVGHLARVGADGGAQEPFGGLAGAGGRCGHELRILPESAGYWARLESETAPRLQPYRRQRPVSTPSAREACSG